MAKLRFLADQPHFVPLVDRVVEPDELVEVDDAVYLVHDWPESTWSPVEVPHNVFDPSRHTVAEVVDHLATGDDAERARVLDAERAGKARAGVLNADNDDK